MNIDDMKKMFTPILTLGEKHNDAMARFLDFKVSQLIHEFREYTFRTYLSNCMSEIEKKREVVVLITVNPLDIPLFRVLEGISNPFDGSLKQRSTGVIGIFWNADLKEDKSQPRGILSLTSDKGTKLDFSLTNLP